MPDTAERDIPAGSRSAVNTLGLLGLPASVRELAERRWDAIIVGAGHNGLSCAAYLARAGKRVLVVERASALAVHAPSKNHGRVCGCHRALIWLGCFIR